MLNGAINTVKYNPSFLPFWSLISTPAGFLLNSWTSIVASSSKVYVTGSPPHKNAPVIYITFHQHLPFVIHYLGKVSSEEVSHRPRTMLMVSQAPYMEPIAKFCSYAGLSLARGSGGGRANPLSGGASSALSSLHRQLSPLPVPPSSSSSSPPLASGSVLLAVDGPSGPAFRVKRGCVDLARSTGCPIVHVSYHCERGTESEGRWDRIIVPKVGDGIHLHFGQEMFVGKDEDGDRCCETLERRYEERKKLRER